MHAQSSGFRTATALSRPCGLCVFDIETNGLYRDGDAVPDLLCAAALELRPAGQTGKYFASVCQTWPVDVTRQGIRAIPARPMNNAEIIELVEHLWTVCGADTRVRLRLAGWNAVGFDLKVLAAHCRRIAAEQGDFAAKAAVAVEHMQVLAWDCCDPMLNFFMHKGFPVRLSAVAETLETALNKNGEGAKASKLWLEGCNIDRLGVLQYCANDVVMTAAVLSQLEKAGALSWISRKGAPNTWVPPNGARTLHAPAHEASTWAFPDNSWMKKRPRAVQHTAGELLNQENQEVASNETLEQVQERELPRPKNYFGWLGWVEKV